MTPDTLALIDDDREFAEILVEHLGRMGIATRWFSDSADLLVDRNAYGFDFYVVDLGLPTVDGLEVVRLIRRRSNAGLLVVTGRLDPDAFEQVLNAGADMFLAKPVRFEQVATAVLAVHRRVAAIREQIVSWRLEREAGALIAPDGARIALSSAENTVMECFLEAAGQPVTRETLRLRLGRDKTVDTNNALQAIVYRLRRRIERETPVVVPLQSQAGIGYVFKALLSEA